MAIFLQCVAEAIRERGVKGLAVLVPGGPYIYEVAQLGLDKFRRRRHSLEEVRSDIRLMAEAGPAQAMVLAQAAALGAQAAAGVKLPDDEQYILVQYLAAIPEAARQSLKRLDDPSGQTVPQNFALASADDVVRLLPPRPPRFRPGAELPYRKGWRLERLVGIGGFGEVWLARNITVPANVGAVKFAFDEQARDLANESKLIARLMQIKPHPNIVPLLDAVIEPGLPCQWLMYEYVAGGTLADWALGLQKLSAEKRIQHVQNALRQLAGALEFCHSQSPPIVHRDLKPSNILLDKGSNRLRITDFGIAGVAAKESLKQDGRGLSTHGGRLLTYLRGSHTPLYASPQQRNGDDPNPQDDVHALGVIGYQLLTGRLDVRPGLGAARHLKSLGVAEPMVDLISRWASEELHDRPHHAGQMTTELISLREPGAGPRQVPYELPLPAAPKRDPKRQGSARNANEVVPLQIVPSQPARRKRARPAPERRRSHVRTFLLLVLAFGIAGAAVAWKDELLRWARRWMMRTPEVEKTTTLLGHRESVLGVAFSPDGRTIASSSGDHTVRLWDAATGKARHELTGHTNSIRSVTFSPNGHLLATGSDDRTVRIWDVATRASVHELKAHTSWVRSVAFSPDGRRLASGGDDRAAFLWDVDRGTSTKMLQNHTDWVNSVAFSPDGRLLATASDDKTVRFWAADTGASWRDPKANPSWVRSIAFSPDSSSLAMASYNKTVQLCEVSSGKTLKELAGHNDWVISVKYSPDGRLVATGSADHTARVWDVTSGTCVKELTGHTDWVHCVAFSPDGRTLATGSGDKSIRLWDVRELAAKP